ncbi:MAG: exo-alpha-sialidase [Pirellulales bacterium]|nr:exo-alpha-sialidase [Pirellulales bacterium]
MQIMKSSGRVLLAASVFSAVILAGLAVTNVSAAETKKLVDKVLYPHDPNKGGVFRWSEASIISLDGKQHLMMLVTALGFGGHDDTAGDILRADSYDGGLTWTSQDKLTVFQKNIGKSNILGPSLLRLDEKELLCFFVVNNKAWCDCGTWMKRSLDNGKTWSKPERLPYEGYGGLASDKAYLTSKGRIILPSWVSMDKGGSTHAYCHFSDDRGKTWEKTALLSVPKGATGRKTDPAAEEPTVVELKDGRLMMFMRTYLKSIFVSYSDDDGATWSKPKSSGIPSAGAMPTLRRMPGGDLLLIWNWAAEEKISGPWPRNRISSAVSTDDGKTWSSLRHLDGSEDYVGKMTMANVSFCNGNAVVTYSKSPTKKNTYDWCLQVMPIKWFYEGDKSVVYGETYGRQAAGVGVKEAEKAKKLVDKVLYPSNPSKNGIYRWSEGSIINLDGRKHLMMVVTGYDEGGHDFTTPARLLELHSYDGGLSWTPLSKAKVFQEKENIAKVSVRDSSLIKLDDGSILAFFSTVNVARVDGGQWVKRSTDGGVTWSRPKKMPFDGFSIMPSDCAVQISGGRVLLPVWRYQKGAKSSSSFCFYSDDRGKTWKRSNEITAPKGSSGGRVDPAAEEPKIVELKDGRLKMFLRTYLGSFYVSYSKDKGATWSDPVDSGIAAPGSMPTVKRMPTGDLLLIYNWGAPEKIVGVWPRSHIKTAVSTDDGKTWTSLRLLDGGDDFQGKMTMANVSFCNGNAVITYSCSPTKKNTYDWRLQVVPINWFYGGDMSVKFGEAYHNKLAGKTARKNKPTGSTAPKKVPRPSADSRNAALKKQAKAPAECKKDTGLVATYSFDANDGAFVYDLTGKENDLAVMKSGKSPVIVDGKSGKALLFDGKGGLLVAPHSKSMDFGSNAFTINAWIYPTQDKRVNAIISKDYSFQVALNHGKLQAAVFSAADGWGEAAWMGDTPIELNKWSHISVSFNGKKVGFMVNGEPAGAFSREAKMAANANSLVVGNISHIDDSTFAGTIDELKIIEKVCEPKAMSIPYPKQPLRTVGRTHQLFIDDELIARSQGIERIVNQPNKYHANPVLTWDRPWEGNCVITWGSILYEPEEKLFKAWYEVYKKFPPKGEPGIMMCYATSRDGFKWDKPNLGLHEFRGSKDNNIFMVGSMDAATVFRDPNPTNDMKYRMYWHTFKEHGIKSAISTDGIHWKVQEGVRVKSGDRTSAGYDPLRKKYYVITRIPGKPYRSCGLWESDDGLKFSFVKEIAAADGRDPDNTQFYGMITFTYQGLHIGFLEPFFIPIRKLDTQLMYSRDGVDWHRAVERQTFLPWGPPGSWDQAWVTPSHNPPIRIGDKLYIFYQGRQTLHWAEEPFGHIGSVGLAFLRPDGFVSMETQWNEGTVTTAPLLLEGDKLHVNAIAKPGTVCAEVLNLEGTPIKGFTRGEAVPMKMVDRLDHVLTWKDNATLAKLVGKKVRMRFYVRGAKLFSFWSE